MKRKITFLIAACLLLTMINLPGKAVGQSGSSYTIEFKDSGNNIDNSNAISGTTISDFISSGSTYVSSINNGGKVFNAKSGFGLKLGSNSGSGNFTITLSNNGKVKVTKIEVYAAKSNVYVKLNNSSTYDHTFSTSESSITQYDWTVSVDVETIYISATKGYIH